MIFLPVDEAYAFDYLSILHIKFVKGGITKDTFQIAEEHISRQVGDYRYLKIIGSKEYRDLVDANIETFEAVDKAKTNEVTAKYVDDCNYKRMVCKRKLHEKFFGGNLMEQKIGYKDE